MQIISFKPSHDSSIAIINEGNLIYSIEAEKNSGPRYSWTTPQLAVKAIQYCNSIPDVVCISGWQSEDSSIAKYDGIDSKLIISERRKFMGKEGWYFSSTHERSHIFQAFGMSDLPPSTPCYVLNWEGGFGKFYEVDENLKITEFPQVLREPGYKYAFLFHLADPNTNYLFPLEAAGKMMALASFSDRKPPSVQEYETINDILTQAHIFTKTKEDFIQSPYYNIGVEHDAFKNLAGKFSNVIFNMFYDFAKANLTKRLPLLITGGCGLNCEWNTKWHYSEIFPSVFVAPCSNDTGSSLGTAIEAQWFYTNNPKIKWNVYAGEEFVVDINPGNDYDQTSLNYDFLAKLLSEGAVGAWVQGRYEIGPRALGNRSIIASPFSKDQQSRLNKIKERASYRPVAPICLEEYVSDYFKWSGESPYMLYFQDVKVKNLGAVTHVDNTARVQTVRSDQNQSMTNLLRAFRAHTGVPVLCNTSLNFPGKGFINEMSQLIKFQKERELDFFVVNDKLYMPKI